MFVSVSSFRHQIFISLVCLTSFTSPALAQALQTDAIVVTATRFAASIDTAPVNITTITAEDIANSSAVILSDVLRYQAGVSVSDLFGISGSKSKIDMGGFGQNGGQNTLVLLNGRRLNDVDLQGTNLAMIPLESITQVEIIHGSGTVLYGDNAVSGVINIVTKNAFDGEGGAIKLESGSFQTHRLSISQHKIIGDTALSVTLDGNQSNGYREQSSFKNFNFSGEASRESGDKIYGLRLTSSNEDLELPGTVNEATFKKSPTASSSTIEMATERRFGIEGFFEGEELAGELALNKKRQDATVFGDTAAKLTTLSFTPRSKRQTENHNIVTGIDLYRSQLDAEGKFSNFSPPPTFSINSSKTTRNSYALYVTDTIDLNQNTSLNIGARHQLVNIKVHNASNISGNSTDSRSDSVNAADLALNYQQRNGARHYIRLARSFRSPVLDEMWSYFSGGINLLDTQTGNHLEVGTQRRFNNGLKASANLFRMELNNEISFDGINNINLNKTQHDGLNININTLIAKNINLQAGYAYRKAHFSAGSNTGNTIPLIPRHKLTLSGQYHLDNNRHFTLDTIYTGKRYFGDDNANVGKQMSAYTRLDVGYTQDFNRWKGRIQIKNLANVNAADTGFYAPWLSPAPPYTYYPLPERAVYFTIAGEL